MRSRLQSIRRSLSPKILIACEGRETEPNYIDAVRHSLDIPKRRVIIVLHAGTDPLSIVQAVIAGRNQLRAENTWEARDQAWAVFDGDEHIRKNPNNWHQALQLAQARKQSEQVNLAISNPSFEFWFLLHFRDHWAHLERQAALRMLHDYISDYDKGVCPYPNPLAPLTEGAKDRAQKLFRRAEHNGIGIFDNPCTHVWRLVSAIQRLTPVR